MTTTIQSVNSIGTGTRFTFAAIEDEFFVLPDVVVASTTGLAINGNPADLTLRIDGAVYGTDAPTINLTGGGSNTSVGQNGSIFGTRTSITDAVIRVAGGDNTILNAGEIAAPEAIAILTSGGGNAVQNTGSISGSTGVFFGSLGDGGGDQLINSGVISANNIGDDDQDARFNNAVQIIRDDSIITNLADGRLIATSTQGAGVGIGFESLEGFGGGSIVTNHGEITSVQAYGVDFSNMANSEVATLTNAGTITGGAGSFRGNESGETVTNSGTMDGNVLLRQGDDTYQGRGGGVVLGEVRGAAGDDTLIGASGEDLFDGGDGEDDLRGRAGDDIVEGGEDDDLVAGNTGDDRVDGNQGDDRLFGNRGDDIVRGGSGDDLIVGGRGDDVLTGNSGADVFVFNRRTDDDIITDFQNNLDQLNLSAFGLANVAALRNVGGIVADGAGSIIDLTVIGGDGVIYVDDMGVSDWTGADFIL